MMGFNTALMICNDALDQLRNDPAAGQKIADGVSRAYRDEPLSISIGNHCNPVTILASEHSDSAQLVIVGGNYIQRVTSLCHRDFTRPSNEVLAERVLRELAADLGYNLSKSAWRKRADAQAIEARRAETPQSGSVGDESAVATPCAQPHGDLSA